MTPVMQTNFAVPGGNCLQAAIASLLELPLEEVPHATVRPDDVWWIELQEWSRRRFGMDLIAFVPGDTYKPSGYHLITGKSVRGVEHATVGLNGAIVHDPHPTGASMAPNTSLAMEGRLFWVFVPMDPSKALRREVSA